MWIVLRNLTPFLRLYSLGLYGWLGCITLETYVSQFHTWLSTGIPDGQPKMLLAFFPPDYPLLNFAGTTAGEARYLRRESLHKYDECASSEVLRHCCGSLTRLCVPRSVRVRLVPLVCAD